MAKHPEIPRWKSLLWPTLEAVKALGGSGSIQEIETKVAELIGATEAQQAVPHGEGRYTEINYRLAWCRTYLKGVGLLTSAGRGVWAITEQGRQATPADMDKVEGYYRNLRKARRQAELADAGQADDDGPDGAGEEIGGDWRDELLKRLLTLTPDRFEHLAKRLLREAGFVQVEVTGRSRDEGIDGTGIYRPSLVSFPVFFQCKRYRGSVGSAKVRDFRGAMSGRGDQGLLITTGTFTADAKAEASRPGAPLVDLIDGDGLCDLMKDYQLGLRVTTRTVEDVELLPEFFDHI
jgi:restriction system protein